MSRSFSWQSLQKETPEETPFFQNSSSYVSEAESEHSAFPLPCYELEKPIKVEPSRRFEPKTKQIEKIMSKAAKKMKRNHAQEENEVKEMNLSRELFKIENELHVVEQNSKLEQLMHTNGHLPSYGHYQDIVFFDEIEDNNLAAAQGDSMIQRSAPLQNAAQDQIRAEQKKRVYLLANSFNAFYHATKLLTKRDSLNKLYQSITNVVLKQSSRMEVEIEKEISRVMNLPQPSPRHQSHLNKKTQPFDVNKQLVITGTELHDDMKMPLKMQRSLMKQEDQ